MNTDETNVKDKRRDWGNPFSRAAELEKFNPITEKIIGSAYKVSNTLGVGFLEKIYENALAMERKKCGLKVQQ